MDAVYGTPYWVSVATEDTLVDALRSDPALLLWHDGDGRRLVHEAGKRGMPRLLKACVAAGMDPLGKDRSGDHALHYALVYQQDDTQQANEVISFLMAHGACQRVHEEGQSLPLLALMADRWGHDPAALREWLPRAAAGGMNLVEEGGHDIPGSPIELVAIRGLRDTEALSKCDNTLAVLHETGCISTQQLRWALARVRDWRDDRHDLAECAGLPRCQAQLDGEQLQRATPGGGQGRGRPRI